MIYDILPVNNYIGNGSSTEFEFDFLIEKPSQLAVYLFDENENKHKLIQDVDYVVSGVNSENGGYITFPIFSSNFDVLQQNQKISLELDIPATQETDYNNSSLLNLSAVERSFDYLTRLVQILKRKLSLCVKVEECSKNSPQDLLDSINNAAILSKENADKSLSILGDIQNEIEKFNKNVQITNCIKEIPQRIKLDLTDGILTLKAGSTVIVPNGFEIDGKTPKFDYLTLESDLTSSQWGSGSTNVIIFYKDASLFPYAANVYSGATAPTVTTTALWYDTTNNLMKYTTDNGSSWEVQNYALPLGIVARNNGTPAEIKQIFNGMGYIGSTIWVDKGVKGLISNGRNEDGSLKNIEIVFDKLELVNIESAWGTIYNGKIIKSNAFGGEQIFFQNQERFNDSGTYRYKYNQAENFWYFSSDEGVTWTQKLVLILADNVNLTSGIISALNFKTVFRAVDYNDKAVISSRSLPSSKYIDLTLGADHVNYTSPASGWVTISKRTNANNQMVELINFSAGLVGMRSTEISGRLAIAMLPVKAGDIFQANYTAGGELAYFRFVYAQGEV